MNSPMDTSLTSPVTGLPYPDFFKPIIANPDVAGMVYMTREEQVAAEARAYKGEHTIKGSETDPWEHGGSAIVIPVDVQTGFGADPNLMFNQTAGGLQLPWKPQGGSLFVPGAPMDTFRLCKFIMDNLPMIGTIDPSMDTHQTFQIFHADSWIGFSTGEAPPAFTVIVPTGRGLVGMHPDGSQDTYSHISDPAKALRYCQILAEKGASPLTIWPYHCRIGSTQHPLMPLLSEVQLFHDIARRADNSVDIKGFETMTESYGIVGDEVGEIDGEKVGTEERSGYIDKLLDYKAIIIAGQASSHCVRATINQIKTHLAARNPGLVKRIWVLRDAMSPVPAIPGFENDPDSPLNFPAVAEASFRQWEAEGLHVVATTDNFLAEALNA